MVIVLGLVVALLGVVILLWRLDAGKAKETTEKLITASLVAESSTHTTMVLAERVKERDDEIERLVEYIAEDSGAAGLVDLLNASMHKDPAGGDDDSGMSN